MARSTRTRTVLSALLALAAAAGAYFVVYTRLVRPRIENWGATEEEAQARLPGDELVPEPKYETTRAIEIDAPVAAVWPWLAQMGYNRAGLYTDRQSATTIMPEFQTLHVGHKLELTQNFEVTVDSVDENKLLVLVKRADMKTGEDFGPDDPKPEQYYLLSLTWLLSPIGDDKTRLILRNRLDYSPGMMSSPALRAITEPILFATERKHLMGIKERAEKSYREGGLQVA